MSDPEIHERLEEVKRAIGWGATTGAARRWWEAFEDENRHQLGVVLRLAEELAARKATITKFFMEYVYSNITNIQANLLYLDYSRLKKKVGGLRKDLGWESADHEARRWWRSREDASGGDLAALVELMERLSNASATIRECFETSRRYGRLELAQVVEIIEASRRGGRFPEATPPPTTGTAAD